MGHPLQAPNPFLTRLTQLSADVFMAAFCRPSHLSPASLPGDSPSVMPQKDCWVLGGAGVL